MTVSNGVKTVYTYDNAGRTLSLTHKKTSDNSVLLSYTPTYDSTSARLSSVAEGPTSATTSYTYDAAGRLLTESRTGANPYASTYTYNSRGLRATAFRSEGGVTSHDGTYTYDNAGRLTTVTQPGVATENYTWWEDSTLKTLPGQTSSYTRKLDYDEEGRLTLIQKDAGGAVTNLFEYGVGFDGKCRSTKDIVSGVWTWLPCSVASCAGELAELQSTNSGSTWSTLGVALRGKGLVRWNSDYSLTDFFGRPTAVGSSSGVTTAIYDAFNVRRGGSATLSRAAIRSILGANDDDGMQDFLTERQLNTFMGILQKPAGKDCSKTEKGYCKTYCKALGSKQWGCLKTVIYFMGDEVFEDFVCVCGPSPGLGDRLRKLLQRMLTGPLCKPGCLSLCSILGGDDPTCNALCDGICGTGR